MTTSKNKIWTVDVGNLKPDQAVPIINTVKEAIATGQVMKLPPGLVSVREFPTPDFSRAAIPADSTVDLVMTSVPITATSRKLKAQWTPDMANDFEASHGSVEQDHFIPVWEDPVNKIMHDMGYDVKPDNWKRSNSSKPNSNL